MRLVRASEVNDRRSFLDRVGGKRREVTWDTREGVTIVTTDRLGNLELRQQINDNDPGKHRMEP